MSAPGPYDPPPLNDLTESDQIRETYAAAGLALYMGQVLEHGLVNLLLVVRLSDPRLAEDFPTVQSFFDTHFQHTMGKLVKTLRLHIDVAEDIDAKLSEALQLRNLIIHHFFRERAEKFWHCRSST